MPRRGNRFGEAAEHPIEQSTVVQLRFEFAFVVVAAAHLRNTRRMPTRITTLMMAIKYKNTLETLVPIKLV